MSKTHFKPIITGALLVVAVLATGVATATAGPKLRVPEKIKDMGTVAQGEVLHVDFELVNEGDELLLIKAVRPTCGCTVADFDREIAPGSSGWLKATLETQNFSGPISKSILIMTNDPEDPTVTVVIKTDVHPYVEVLPRPLVRFNAVQHEPMNQKVIVVAGEDDKDFQVTGVESSVPFLVATVRPLPADELLAGKSSKQYEISLSIKDDAQVGPVNGVLEVQTNHPKAKVVSVKVFGLVRALLNVTPSQVQFGSVEAKKEPGRNLIVVNNRSGGEKIEVTSAHIDDDAFAAEVVTIEEGRRYQVIITVKRDASKGPRDAELTLKTTDAEFPELKVPVRAN
ncbi:MAG: DUF1573 domain-containing protein, partial [Thermoanaerobaculales bacterium]